MTFLLISFFISLVGVSVMLGRKLAIVQSEPRYHFPSEDLHFEIPHLEEIKKTATHKFKKYSYAALVISLRIYIRGANILKQKFKEFLEKIEKTKRRNLPGLDMRKQEQGVSNFLEVVSEYKHKIRKLKHQIAKEEEME